LFKNEGLEVTFPVGKADVQLAAVVSGEMEYIAAGGTVLLKSCANKRLKGPLALGQVLDYGILKEVLADMKR